MDEIAKIYIMQQGNIYRIKVFEKTIGIERQDPREDNVLFNKADYPRVYWGEYQAWVIDILDILITDYEAYIADVNANLDAESN
jgi:hypothetical protein